MPRGHGPDACEEFSFGQLFQSRSIVSTSSGHSFCGRLPQRHGPYTCKEFSFGQPQMVTFKKPRISFVPMQIPKKSSTSFAKGHSPKQTHTHTHFLCPNSNYRKVVRSHLDGNSNAIVCLNWRRGLFFCNVVSSLRFVLLWCFAVAVFWGVLVVERSCGDCL